MTTSALMQGDQHPAFAGAESKKSVTPPKAKKTSDRNMAILKMCLFVFFILTRALHPILIDLSKHDGKILYAKNTPIVMNKIVTVCLMNLCGFLTGGMDGVRQCWQPKTMLVFGMIGTVYALGDFLEMLSMSKLSGGVYQVLLQTKLVITALMAWWLKGSGQSPLQWHVLFAMFLAMSSFVLVDLELGSGGSSSDASLPLMACFTVIMKVAVSCYCAVLSEKYLKAFSNMPLYAKISGLGTTWAISSFLICLATEPKVHHQGFFGHWDGFTVMVMFSFTVKTVSTMYLLQLLDSVQKNIGEALAVIVIYIAQVSFASFGKAFELSVFLLALLVVILVKTYLIAPKVKAKKPAALQARKMQLVALKPQGTQMMSSMGVDTITCEVEDALPSGVFYGMLGGVHPVCGATHPRSSRQCELMLLSHPPVTKNSAAKILPSDKTTPFIPCKSLTVLGHLRDALPREQMTPDQFMQDLENARAHLHARCVAELP